MSDKQLPKSLEQRVKEFMSRPDYPQQLRRNAARAYHPDNFTDPTLKKSGEEIMKRINSLCDRLKDET